MVTDWERVKELLYQAMQLDPEQRCRFLDGACSGDSALRAELESLLSANQKVRSDFLSSVPQPDGVDTRRTGLDEALEAGECFAERFQLIRKLGEGGMGQVWLAEQTSPVRRLVALKLIKAGIYDQALIGRFRSEWQSLAMMDHPAIAKVFDAGTTPQGQPYLVMEYVPGLPITQYCDRNRLPIRERLELFIRACEGIQHAHQKAIIHRDLKPANILVPEVDGRPMPRIIDFGLARAATPLLAGDLSEPGHLVGTPGYMSPEQADPRGSDIDTRTDVYSLGVVLYVLLAGCKPFEPNSLQNQPLDEWLRKLREDDPPRPSARIGADRGTAEARCSDSRHLVKQLRGDLDSIALKALERNRDNRYAAPSDLAADIFRYLKHEPVAARPASALYRLRRYVRRRRATVMVAGGLLLLLAGFSILQAVELRRIIRERDRADRITDFMTGMFKVPDPGQARGNSVTAREILDKASNEMRKGLAADAEVQSQLMHVMARTYVNLGLYGRAHDLAKRALDARLSFYGTNDRHTLESMSQLAFILDKEGRDPEAEKLARQAVTAQRRDLGPEDPLTLETMDTLAIILQHEGHYDEEEQLEREG
jgi:non-specific serine/threonine protein kinase/serine/threonine-protein kinase